MKSDRMAILGASRGLGAALAKHISSQLGKESELILVSRKKNLLEELSDQLDSVCQCLSSDFSKTDEQESLMNVLTELKPSKIFYVAGGGPFGEFKSKDWKDHQWAWQVSFEFPAKLLHRVMQEDWCQQFVAVGSSVAEDSGDPFASSYAAAKHALHGLHASIEAEKSNFDFRLFSPGYMDTDLLPPNAYPRQHGAKIEDPKEVAKKLWEWSNTENSRRYRG